jgi:hypothetical protein
VKCIDRKGLLGKEDSLENEIRVLQRYLQKLIRLSTYSKPVYKGHPREHEYVPFMSSCPLYTG